MNPTKIFDKLKAISLEMESLTIESDTSIAAIKQLCRKLLTEIDKLKEDSISRHVILTKNQAKEYIQQGLSEIEKYNNKVIIRNIGNFVVVLRPVQAGIQIILNLNY